MSPTAVVPAVAAADHHQQHQHQQQHHKVKSRGLSPFRPTNKDHGHHGHHQHKSKSPLRMRSLSPFGRSSSSHQHHEPHGAAAAACSSKMVCHESAHAIVFRDHLRLARKIIQEVNEDALEELDDDEEEEAKEKEEQAKQQTDNDSDDDDSDSDSEHDGEKASAAFSNLQSLKQSLRASMRDSGNHEIEQEIRHLAHDLVPELKTVTVDFQTISERNIEIEGLHAHITPLPELEHSAKTDFSPLLLSSTTTTTGSGEEDWTAAERQVYQALVDQQACVKTIQKSEWPSFIKRFLQAKSPSATATATSRNSNHRVHDDIPPSSSNSNSVITLNSFVTSTTLLPSQGKKMRCYGSEASYPVGVVFLLPGCSTTSGSTMMTPDQETQAVQDTQTWAWPAGYAAKTEFNIDHRSGKLINGRQEALVSLEQLRRYNHDYLHKTDHFIAGRIISGGFSVVPYNEVFLRVGGPTATPTTTSTTTAVKRSFDKGVGFFAALLVRSTSLGDLMYVMRTRARIRHMLASTSTNGQQQQHARLMDDMPLLYLHHDHGVRVFTQKLQLLFWHQIAQSCQPFLNPSIASTTRYHETNENSLQQKLQELLDLQDIVMIGTKTTQSQQMTHLELAKIAGGFGITDDSLLTLLTHQPNFQHVHDIVQAGFAGASRANDYYTARQFLILYSLANTYTWTTTSYDDGNDDDEDVSSSNKMVARMIQQQLDGQPAALYSNTSILHKPSNVTTTATTPAPAPTLTKLPSPLATKRLRRSTNSDGLLVVLGAAQILKTITTTSAKRRTEESYAAVEEWVHHGEESVTFRVASWREQRADEADSNIAMSTDSKFMAFVTNKSVHNRRKFAQQLRKAAPPSTEFTTIEFLQGIYEIVEHMHSPCMRLELLQYILGLDNRYSVQLIKESIELAATCLSVVSSL